jgi:AraC-like DNA-binding protein
MADREYGATPAESKEVRRALRMWLLKNGIRPENRPAVAKALGVSEGTVYNIFNEEKNVSYENFMRALRILHGGELILRGGSGAAEITEILVEPEFDPADELARLLDENAALRRCVIKLENERNAVRAAMGLKPEYSDAISQERREIEHGKERSSQLREMDASSGASARGSGTKRPRK